jgi:hypothetical protein
MKKGIAAAIEMTPRRQPSGKFKEIETDYQPVNWKRLFLTPKYLGGCSERNYRGVRRRGRGSPQSVSALTARLQQCCGSSALSSSS